MEYRTPETKPAKSSTIPIAIGCGCLFILFLIGISGTLLWIYIKKNPTFLDRFKNKKTPSVEQSEAPTPEHQWNPGEDVNTNYIAMLKARIGPLRFFEGTRNDVAERTRNFRYSFVSQNTRAIFWNLDLENPKPGQTISFRVDEVWLYEGKLLAQQSFTTSIQPEWTTSYHYDGWGYLYPGQWRIGQYRVVLYVNGIRISSGYFTISDTQCGGAFTTFTRHQLLNYDRQAEAYRGQDSPQAEAARRNLAIAYNNRAGNCYLNGNTDAAISYYTKSLNILPDSGLAYLNRAMANYEINNLQLAIQDSTEAIRLRQDDAYFYDIRAKIYLFNGNTREALQDLNRAIELDPENPEYLKDRGIAAWRLWDREAALADFMMALKFTNDQKKKEWIQSYIEMVSHSYPIVPEHIMESTDMKFPQ